MLSSSNTTFDGESLPSKRGTTATYCIQPPNTAIVPATVLRHFREVWFISVVPLTRRYDAEAASLEELSAPRGAGLEIVYALRT